MKVNQRDKTKNNTGRRHPKVGYREIEMLKVVLYLIVCRNKEKF